MIFRRAIKKLNKKKEARDRKLKTGNKKEKEVEEEKEK